MVMKRYARATGIAVLVLTFVVGALVGAATMQVVRAGEPVATKPPSSGRHGTDFLDRLGLTTEQREEADRILERRRAQMEVYRPLLRAIGDSARAELRGLLTPEQRAMEEQYMAERRAHFQKREKKDDK